MIELIIFGVLMVVVPPILGAVVIIGFLTEEDSD